jgi:hypothetical protein
VTVGLFLMFWLIGEGIIVYRSVKANHAPPMPGELLASSGLFALLALIAEADQARTLAVMLAAGFDVAAALNLFPPVTSPGTSGAHPAPAAGAPGGLTTGTGPGATGAG